MGFFLLTALIPPCFSQEAQVFYAEGGEFAYSSGGQRFIYQGNTLDAAGISLNREDILQTGPGSFVEIRLIPEGTRIKLAENTSLVCNGPGTEGGSMSFSLLYGRIRLSTRGSWPAGESGAVFIQSGNAETIFRRGDAGIDFLVNISGTSLTRGEPILRVYGFSGIAEVVPVLNGTPSGQWSAARFQVPEKEVLSIEILNSFSYLERKPFEEDIARYWNRHDFSGGSSSIALREPSQPEPQAAPQIIERTLIEYVKPDYRPFKRVNRVKNAFIITGTVFVLGGAAMHGMSFYYNDLDDRVRDMLKHYGYGPLSLGVFFLTSSLFINPKIPETDAAE
jgi:hypothetical protein